LDIPEELPNEDTWMDLCIRFIKSINIKHEDGVACCWRVHEGNSITIKQGFEEFNKKFSARMKAMSLFLDKYRGVLSEADVSTLKSLIECEEFRVRGQFVKILLSGVPLSDKLRNLFYSNAFFFSIRSKMRSI